MCNAWNHPSWCRCGFGGEGHNGRGGQYSNPNLFDYANTHRWHTDDFCVRRICPKCRKYPVYFIRYNGGSVWVENLGPPWTKHPCFNFFNQTNDPFQLLLFDPPSENPLLAIVVQASRDPSNTHLHFEVKCENGEIAFIECKVASSADNLEGSLIFVYPKCRQFRLAPLGTLHATRLQFASEQQIVATRTSTIEAPKTSDESLKVQAIQNPPASETERQPKRHGLNWTEEELAQWEKIIVQEVTEATRYIIEKRESEAEAKRLAMKRIDCLPRPLCKLLRHRFELAKWRPVVR